MHMSPFVLTPHKRYPLLIAIHYPRLLALSKPPPNA